MCEEFLDAPQLRNSENESPALIAIFVRTLTGTMLELLVGQMESIADVKHRIRDNFGPSIAIDRMSLSFNNEQVADQRFLKDYDVQVGAVLDLILYYPVLDS
jgi:hypothetical protein